MERKTVPQLRKLAQRKGIPLSKGQYVKKADLIRLITDADAGTGTGSRTAQVTEPSVLEQIDVYQHVSEFLDRASIRNVLPFVNTTFRDDFASLNKTRIAALDRKELLQAIDAVEARLKVADENDEWHVGRRARERRTYHYSGILLYEEIASEVGQRNNDVILQILYTHYMTVIKPQLDLLPDPEGATEEFRLDYVYTTDMTFEEFKRNLKVSYSRIDDFVQRF